MVGAALLACRPAPGSAQAFEPSSEGPGAVYREGEPGVDVRSDRTFPNDPRSCEQCPPGGCAGLDCDGDGIADHDDACPSVAEDLDAFEDDDGCPDADNDLDGVPDVDDACPDQAGTVDGRGCP